MNTNLIKSTDFINRKKSDQINFRIDFIEKILAGKQLKPLFMAINDNVTGQIDSSVTNGNRDIRTVLQKDFFKLNQVIKDLGGKLIYVKSGSTGHTFRAISPLSDNNETIDYAVKIVAYPKRENYGNMYDITRPENAELLMLSVLSYFVKNKETPHIVLPICTFNTSIKPIINLPRECVNNNKKFDQFVKKYEKKEYYDKLSVLISEWVNGGDLLDYIRNNYRDFKLKHWRVLFFQIISVLAIIQTKYPAFRHNDLKANNILVQIIETTKDKNNKYRYKINNTDYIIPNVGFQIKIWDFDFACIPGIVDNAKVSAEWTSKINIKPERNQYYDIHYFFNTFTRKGFFPEFYTSCFIPDEAKEFVKRIIPQEYRFSDDKDKEPKIHERGRLLVDDEYLTPDNILKNDPFFSKMRFK
jgi:hypothetical protein